MNLSRHLFTLVALLSLALIVPALPQQAEAQPRPRVKRKTPPGKRPGPPRRPGPPGTRPKTLPGRPGTPPGRPGTPPGRPAGKVGKMPPARPVGRVKTLTPAERQQLRAKNDKARADRRLKRRQRRSAWKKMNPAQRQAWRNKKRAALKDAKTRQMVTTNENRKHVTRMAKLDRLDSIARSKNDAKMSAKVTALRQQERERHGKALAFIKSAQ